MDSNQKCLGGISYFVEGPRPDIGLLFVRQYARAKGIGTALVNCAIAQMRNQGVHNLYLLACPQFFGVEDNDDIKYKNMLKKLVKFYEGLKFKQDEEQASDDEVSMSLSLSG